MLKIKVNDYEEISTFISEENEQFFSAIYQTIRNGWEDRLTVVTVVEFIIKETETIIDISIDEDDWNESLHMALYYYEREEEYEMCTKLQKLIYDIYGND